MKTKLSCGAPARDLYVSDYFTKMRTYAEGSGRPWFILSAEHGLVAPDEWLEPYERYLPATSGDYRRHWGARVTGQLEHRIGPLTGVVVDIHAGAAYVHAVDAAVSPLGPVVVDRLKGLSFGRRLSWYVHHEAPPGAGATALSKLQDPRSAQPLADVMAGQGTGLRVPGMYSWWVDEAGAAELTAGLGYQIRAGLIYAGLAGATRSSGKKSTNTLWGRIATMHLGSKHQLSTLRYSLGSILAQANGRQHIDEAELSLWMYAHLRIIPVPIHDADTLDHLETQLLSALDPPLNLAKVQKTALRERLSTLRKKYGGERSAAGEATN